MSVECTERRRKEAQRLAGLWNNISRQHLSSAQGCACGFGGGLILQGASFELDIIEFVLEDARTLGHANVEPFIDAVCKSGPDRYSLRALFGAISSDTCALTDKHYQLDFILSKSRRVLGSIGESHMQRFACV